MATLHQKVAIGMAMGQLPDTFLSHLMTLGADPNNAAAAAAYNAVDASRRKVIDGYVAHLKGGGTLKKDGGGTIGPLTADQKKTL